jgi:ABC-type multidrug transport system ATPase subunit
MDSNHILRVNHIAKTFGRRKVLNDISFQVDKGKILAIMGENGAGKSTLLKIMVGLLKPDAGNIELHGSLGYCPQELMIFERLTMWENLKYFYTAYNLEKNPSLREEKKVLGKWLERFKFEEYRDMQAGQLSGGTKQKLNLTLALMHEPDILILDEPYAAFDWQTYLHFWELAAEFRDKGKSVIVVSHIIYDKTKIDLLYQLKEGNLQCA